MLRVLATYAEPGAPPETAAEMLEEFRLMQAWLGLSPFATQEKLVA